MPFKRTRFAKRKFKKKRVYRKRPRMTLTKSVAQKGLADRQWLRLTYTEFLNPNPGAITSNVQWNLNSLFDPNRTGVGHQPMFYDQWSGLYNRYKVHGCSWKLEFNPANVNIITSVYPSNETGGPADTTDAAEQRYSVTKSTFTAATRPTVFKGYISMKKLYGRSELENKDEALTSSNPTETAILNAYTTSSDLSSNVSTHAIRVTLKYYCEMFDRKDHVGS